MNPEKIKVTALCTLKTTGRKLYFTLEKKLQDVYELHIGDILKVEILEVHRKKQETEE
jgi:hypothetical protein